MIGTFYTGDILSMKSEEEIWKMVRGMYTVIFFMCVACLVLIVPSLVVHWLGGVRDYENFRSAVIDAGFLASFAVFLLVTARFFLIWPFENFGRGSKAVVNFNKKRIPAKFCYVLWTTIIISLGLGVKVALEGTMFRE